MSNVKKRGSEINMTWIVEGGGGGGGGGGAWLDRKFCDERFQRSLSNVTGKFVINVTGVL